MNQRQKDAIGAPQEIPAADSQGLGENVREQDRKRRVTVNRISVPKPQDVLAEHLRESILRGEIPEGEGLPSERELVDQTGLSRGAVRQALRKLSDEGLVQTRHGRFGGSMVTLPGQDSISTAINRFVRGQKVSLRIIQETRELLEPYLARQAAERRTEEHLRALKSLHEALIASGENFREFANINVKWHNAVAAASGNELLATVLYSISQGVHAATMVEEYDTPDTHNQVIRIHARVNAAIEARDGDLAESSMRKHIHAANALPLRSSGMEISLAGDRPARARAPASVPVPVRRGKK
ncbi:FadR/GntR family transcriptional regulator [Variovorax saccharolyticus]|uniref:FadR/GntR family transcriptional regulator n=1 Tax=Variovorax saccharolyticus TaxID=3053516 RepID=UPI00257497CD|nr:FCD domain-containing protein [Variovorax sp. J22R187]MDM0021779.1 FCD domain-containing protein [Variovorax sp. J22R187]